MKNIRLGNDILIRTDLKELGTEDKLKVKSLRCIITRTDYPLKADGLSIKYYEPSEYTYGCCGCDKYNVPVYNNGYGMFCTAGDPHWFPTYNGFGVCSPKFKYLCNEYSAAVKVFDSYIEAYMPAKEQKVGTYKVVFIATIYQDGWGIDNLKTVTIDEGELFSLINSSDSGIYEDGLIDLTLLDIDNIYCDTQYKFIEKSTYKFGDVDYDNNIYQIQFTLKGSQNKYTINSENANNFEFNISGAIDNNIHISETGDIILSEVNQSRFNILINSKRNPEIQFTISCTICGCDEVKNISCVYDQVNLSKNCTYSLNDLLFDGKRYGFILNNDKSLNGLLTENKSKLFTYKLTCDEKDVNINSTIDENGNLSVRDENFNNLFIHIYSKKDKSISTYISASVSDNKEFKPIAINANIKNMVFKSGEILELNTNNIGGQNYGFNFNTQSLNNINIDKYSAKYFNFNISSKENLSSIDEYGTLKTKTTSGDDITITCKLKNADISTYINASVTQL